MRKKVLALVLALVMVIAMLPTVAFAADYADTTGNWAEASIDRWTDAGIIEGNPDGTFAPDNNLKRSEFAKTMTNLMKITETADLSVYTDVDPNGWYVEALEGVVAKGIMKGTSDTTLSPDNNLTREQMFVMIGRALGVEPAETCEKDIPDSETASDWSIGYINALVNMGVINGIDAAGDVAPLADIQRGATMAVLDRLIGGYANEDGQTVTIVPGKITLVVADEVKVEGTADPDLPIVVAGGAAKVDMEGVEGEATVQVQVSDVAIENAPVGTEIVADETTTGVTANGIDVSGDADKDVIIPEPTTPAPSNPAPAPAPAPAPTESVKAENIDKIIEDGRVAVNAEMKGEDDVPYAFIPEFSTSGTEVRNVIVTIYDGDVNIGAVKTDIMDVLVEKLQAASNQVTTVTAVKTIEDADVAEGTEGKTLTLSSTTPTDMDVYNFVKALIPDASGLGKIGGLVDKQGFTVEVADVESGSFATTVQYKVTFKMASLDDVIAEKIPEISETMKDYATAEWDGTNHTLNVVITNDTTELGTVYTNIGSTLVDAFNLVRNQLSEVKDAVSEGTSKLTISTKINDDELIKFVKGLKIKDSSSSSSQDLTQLLSSGQAKVILLLGHEFNISVTGKEELPTGASTDATYTIKFLSKLDSVIAREIPNISEKMKDYATAEWKGDTHTLEVKISKGETEVGTVYDDIADMLCTAFNKARTTLSTVKDALQDGTSELQDLQTKDLDNDTLKAFVKDLKISTKNSEVKTVMEVLQQNEGLKIKGLDGCKFEINVTGKGQDTPVKYTISFTTGD